MGEEISQVRLGRELVGPDGENFRLTEFLGEGAFGQVYRAVGVSSDRVLAVKLLPVGEMERPEVRDALLNEADLALRISHPNVVRILHVDKGTSADIGPYIMTEYVSGGTLATLLRARRKTGENLPLERARAMMVDIAEGARAINQILIHRDMKPDNILMDGKRLRIGDFGISKVVDERTRRRTFKGGQHVRYMAPEGWEGAKNTYKLDVYSVGLVFHEILTLKHPLEALVIDTLDWSAWRDAHLFQAVPDVRVSRHDVGTKLSQLLERMVSKRPQERPDWEEALAVLVTEAEPTPAVSGVLRVVDAAIRRHHEDERNRLARQETVQGDELRARLYAEACRRLADRLDRVVGDFNDRFQHGNIVIRTFDANRSYVLPTRHEIHCEFFPRRETGIKIGGGILIGGGYLGIPRGVGGNLLLLREGEDDLYGRWELCYVRVNPVTDVRMLIGTRGIELGMMEPFGFRAEQDFYQEISWAGGGMHVFTYERHSKIEEELTGLLTWAFENMPGGR